MVILAIAILVICLVTASPERIAYHRANPNPVIRAVMWLAIGIAVIFYGDLLLNPPQ